MPLKPECPYVKTVEEGEFCGPTGFCDADTTREWYTSNLVVTALHAWNVMNGTCPKIAVDAGSGGGPFGPAVVVRPLDYDPMSTELTEW